ncbi:MAG: PD40 domain-containing protein [Planctomycetes bacterium]|nr:PD40 domain-containing protein [Planctomycetota bacterium]
MRAWLPVLAGVVGLCGWAWMVWAEGTGDGLVVLCPRLRDGKPDSISLSPAGQELLYVTSGTTGESGVWIADRAGTPVRRLLTDKPPALLHSSPEWSPDGRSVAYQISSMQGAPAQFLRVGVMDLASGKSREFDGLAYAWTPDGASIAVADPAHKKLRVYAVASGDATELGEYRDVGHLKYLLPSLAWSPDGQTLAFSATPDDAPNLRGGVWVVDRKGGAPKQVFEWKGDRTGVFPTWSKDGKRLAILELHYGRPAGSRIVIVGADGSDSREAYKSDGLDDDYAPGWSPDGARFALVRGVLEPALGMMKKEKDLWVVDAGNGRLTQVTTTGALGGRVRWSADGRTLVVEGGGAVTLIPAP